MKRLTAVLCAALMVAAACVTCFAAENGSPNPPINPPRPPRPPYVQPTTPTSGDSSSSTASTTTASSTTAASTTAAATTVSGTPMTVDTDPSVTTIDTSKAIVLVEAAAKDYAENSVERKIIDMFSDGQTHDVSEIFAAIGVNSDTLQAAPSNKVVALTALAPISKPLAMKYADGTAVPAGKVKGTFAGNEMSKGLADGQLFALSVDTRSNPTAVALGDGSVDSSNNCTVNFQNTGLQLLMKNNG